MSDSLEHQLDLALDTRRQRHRQRKAGKDAASGAIDAAHAELEQRQARFCGEVRALLQQAVERANRHMAKRPERLLLREVSGYFTGPLYAGGSACNPIAYELCVDGEARGEALIVELTADGMIDVSLGPFRPHVSEGHSTRIDFGWQRVALDAFDGGTAADIVVRYVTAVTARWSPDHAIAGAG